MYSSLPTTMPARPLAPQTIIFRLNAQTQVIFTPGDHMQFTPAYLHRKICQYIYQPEEGQSYQRQGDTITLRNQGHTAIFPPIVVRLLQRVNCFNYPSFN